MANYLVLLCGGPMAYTFARCLITELVLSPIILGLGTYAFFFSRLQETDEI